MNSKYDDVKIPDNIDINIENGVKKAVLEKAKIKNKRKKKMIGTIAASVVVIVTLGIANPALASKIPVIGNVFEAIEKNIHFPGNYSQYATSVNETAYSNGIGVTLSEILCDGESLYVTYIVENEKPFKYTSWDGSEALDMNQLITEEVYSKVDFTDEELDNTGFAGLEGKFIDENTFVGVEKYTLSTLKTEIPDQFVFQNKIVAIENYAIEDADKDYVKWGTWAFKVPVTVNKELRQTIDLTGKEVESETAKIQSISITPFEMIMDVNYKVGNWHDYRVLVFDENGERIEMSQSQADDESGIEKIFLQAPSNESKAIRVVIEKPILVEKEKWENKHGNGIIYDEVGREIVFDKVIKLQ